MENYGENIWAAATANEIASNNPETIVLRSALQKGPQSFKVNKNLLCHHSKYFDSAINGQWKEGVDRKK
ncbi:hypothetical protein AUEXF2481DRAFT_5291 [Aureobasidium subglaciale EXF-2481]|uniref:BTB domain-containing protein n=1 Tax=Aureobasidium subglaciale (strain EXF-2481) TaxID=1043005 RepID=A0A074YB83_AURSE|nr:uncharacterized protein AUEXF2481DRAFT_5291 [Aureobasidium subglaciale EXF-2481]KAI5211745.1 hypothetical protein E4T38_01207 [Aureobasidium subglaciale]KAI5230349.1 hypothetical protein E4T40_01208 [Aureobasidium subglaciale]KAI5233524.1 hypothetical protein E4T41_01206 [Aureobasidium subglaciale]KAI5266906.1 hypothetical protein E4T46_01206 [Aureobasidium subglaciale]KEQ95048.1 hypothetical protein AUEXF2481DRAFT_5291 [Aureobasidium subglaciale EXF-2481]